ncbi:GNAT family N-acetyltransferase [Paenibacillus caui]|uniref:GNAT family N-acetyltransferase n=1 Tax=Paenibacillus caui TaxID=2873927 RepID=UPI001CA84E83|nr:GNAT family N-acetyltransferase [Paenibacillus caui]
MNLNPDILQQWAEFNERKWNCRTRRVQFRAPNSPAYGEALFFLNQHGKLYLPPLNPYHPVRFHSTPTDKVIKLGRQWHEVAKTMIPELLKVRGAASFVFTPDIVDIRPFLWNGFKADIKYTYLTDLPYSIDQAGANVRRKINKADEQGYRSARAFDMTEVYQCLQGTESRQGFNYQLSPEDLKMAQSLLGEQAFRAYVCYSKEGEPVSANVIIILDDNRPFKWIAGSKTEHLTQGVAQQVELFTLLDLASSGFKEFDFAGANISSVAASKANWGGRITPYYLLRTPGYKEVLRAGRDWLRFSDARKVKSSASN